MLVSSSSQALTFVEEARLIDPAPFEDDFFGVSSALSGEVALVGVPGSDPGGVSDQGVVRVFTRSGGVWGHTDTLVSSFGASLDRFGTAVAFDGGHAIVGMGSNGGWAEAYGFTGSSWSNPAFLTPVAGGEASYGSAVAVDGSWAAVTDPTEGTLGSGAGTVHVYELVGSSWEDAVRLFGSNTDSGDRFGQSVAISFDRMVVGAYADEPSQDGAAYVFELDGATWPQIARLTPSSATTSEWAGWDVDIDGDTIVVGAPTFNGNGVGSVYIYEPVDGTYEEVAHLVPDDPTGISSFGRSVDIEWPFIAVGAPGAHSDRGAVFLYELTESGWTQQAKLEASDGAAGDSFGEDVSLSGLLVLAGAYLDDHSGHGETGSVYAFDEASAPVPVPELATLLLSGIGLTGVVVASRLQRR